MSRDTRRYLVMAAILALAAAAVAWISFGEAALGRVRSGQGYPYITDIDNWRRTERERAVQSAYNLSLEGDLAALPMQIGDWRGEDVPQTNLEVFILLEPEQYIQRIYTHPDGHYLWLSLIASRKSKSFHSPQICYDADGWATEASSERIALQQGEIYALRLAAAKQYAEGDRAEHVVLYFYVWTTPDRDANQGMVLFKVTAPLIGSLEETLELEKSFIARFFTQSLGHPS